MQEPPASKPDTGPFATMSAKDRDEWVDLIANSGSGETSAIQQIEGLEQGHIDEQMLESGYDRCTRCDWWVENHETHVVDDECVCDDCVTDDERED